jgi:protein O-mannosyl-transferase
VTNTGSSAEAEGVQRRAILGNPILLVLAGALVAFGAGLGGSFHLDDYTLFSDPAVTSPDGWWYVWHPLQTRPLTYFTFWLNYQLGGQNPIGYHAVDIGLHLLAIWLLYGTCVRLVGDKAALVAATVFAVHPIQTEAVQYVFARAILLATIFCLLSLRSWLDEKYWSAAGWFILALLSKEECAAFPLFLLLIRPAFLPAAGMLGLSLSAGGRVFLALKALHVTGAGATAGISPLAYLATQGIVILRYFRLLFVPYGFSFDPDIPVIRDWRAWLAWMVILAAAAVLWRWRRQGRWFAAGLVLLAPSSTIFPAQDLAADRRLYLPMIAFAILAGLLLSNVPRRLILIAAGLGLIAISFQRTLVWRTERTLWADAVERAPRKLRPRILLARASDRDQALEILDEAKAIAPNDPNPPLEKGLRLMEAKLPDLALAEFEQALALAPDDPKIVNNHGVALSQVGRREAAIEEFRRALRMDPCWSSARENLRLLGVSYPVACQ